MNRIDRLFGIFTLLQSKKYTPAEKIAEKFNISIRTVYRDLKALNESGIPLGFEQAKGYFIVQGFFLPPISLTSDEANALLIMESIVYRFTDKSIQKHYTNALNKVKAVLPNAQKDKIDSLSDTIKIQVPPNREQHNYEYLSTLQQAISAKTIIDFDYKNNSDEISSRRAEPIGLVFYAFNWHLIAWCHKRNDYRDFRVSRIIVVKDTQMSFQKNDHIPLSDYMKLLPVNY
ncbi:MULTISPECIES: YafY family protein [unclassified Arcicella]|uniref:helix-turn-helix transcriptional regulator n=1 Tax=unclassified Arcicella TaxID=2644986 RepID=UPI002855F949|nr:MULTISPECIES: YafY family protein [unclassified Arcicella]MDR6563485.1 putative DNA-binding transcriptional regulator YafY [Arcicella sp. BE51]MDR6813403.1 putative DNA-binding transcriptional regulator YafY [Arcicella sp. BE140]MDR6824716.1 putative DNA-binding transcriptional regulator YafY [Arcicella sp. BE139]